MKKKKEKSIITETVKHVIIAAVVFAVLVMFSYCWIQFRAVSRNSME